MSTELQLENGEVCRSPGDVHPARWNPRWLTGCWLHLSSHQSVFRDNCGKRQCYQVGSEDSQHINDTLQGRAVTLSLMHARLPGSDGPIVRKVLIFIQEVVGGKGMKV